jgi:hypothetical protein
LLGRGAGRGLAGGPSIIRRTCAFVLKKMPCAEAETGVSLYRKRDKKILELGDF